MNRFFPLVSGLLFWTAVQAESAPPSLAGVESVRTGLAGKSCRKTINPYDSQEAPYQTCRGVGGYRLIVRKMDAGSPSIALLNTDERVFPLNLHETVTPHLFSVGDQVEWRVLHAQGKQTPGALIVRVAAHEEAADPGRVTHTYVAVAKISPSAVCVTDVLSEGSQPEAEIRLLADSALSKSCVPSFPSMAALRDPS